MCSGGGPCYQGEGLQETRSAIPHHSAQLREKPVLVSGAHCTRVPGAGLSVVGPPPGPDRRWGGKTLEFRGMGSVLDQAGPGGMIVLPT